MAPALDEFELIARFFAPLARETPGAMGLRDDAAGLKVAAGAELVVSADAIVAGVHFPENAPPADVARRALRVNLSDIAAKGATPRAYTLTLQLPADTTEDWLREFADTLAEDQRTYGVGLLGGDTTRTSGPLTLSINIFGEVSEDKWIKRSGAGPADDVYVTGSIGDAWIGLAVHQGRIEVPDAGDRAYFLDRFARPEPRVFLGPRLVGIACAAADVSDGLVADLGHICTASNVAAELRLPDVPLSPAAQRLVTDDQPLALSLVAGGDDYEIVFTAPAEADKAIAAVARETGVAVTKIGRTVDPAGETPRVAVVDGDGCELEVRDGGYRHFADADARRE